MQVVLLQDVGRLGRKGAIVSIADGYARNFLFPRKLAEPATSLHAQQVHAKASADSERRAMEKTALKEHLALLDGKAITLAAAANEKGHLFKGINREDVQRALEDQHCVPLPASSIVLAQSLKEVGEHSIEIRAEEVSARISVRIQAR